MYSISHTSLRERFRSGYAAVHGRDPYVTHINHLRMYGHKRGCLGVGFSLMVVSIAFAIQRDENKILFHSGRFISYMLIPDVPQASRRASTSFAISRMNVPTTPASPSTPPCSQPTLTTRCVSNLCGVQGHYDDMLWCARYPSVKPARFTIK